MPTTYDDIDLNTAAELGAAKAQHYMDLKKRFDTGTEIFSRREQNELTSLESRPKNATISIAQEKLDRLNQFPTSFFTSKTQKEAATKEVRLAEAYEYGYSLKIAKPELVNPALNQTLKAGVQDALYQNSVERNLQDRVNQAQKNVVSVITRFFSSTATQAQALQELGEARQLYNNFQKARQKVDVPPPASLIEKLKEASTSDVVVTQKPAPLTTGLDSYKDQQQVKSNPIKTPAIETDAKPSSTRLGK